MKVLGLIFTINVSLETWVESGLFYREKRIYEEHLKHGNFDKIIWFTYGVNDVELYTDLVTKGLLDARIEVVPMPKWIKCPYRYQVYSVLLPFIQKKYCKQIDIIKTNQMGGAWTAEIISKWYKCTFWLRTGYTYSTTLHKKYMQCKKVIEKFKLREKEIFYRYIEKRLYNKCDFATVSSNHDKEMIKNDYKIPDKKITVITNFVDCRLFRPIPIEKQERFVFVGRLSKEKNIFNIISAVVEAGYGLDIYGDGILKDELVSFVKKNNYDVEFKGLIENEKLPMVLNQYKYFILCSEYEGMPKTLLEAMACGLICIGSDVSGINEVLCDGKNGFLAQRTSMEAILECIIRAKEAEQILKEKISKKAREYIVNNNSIDVIIENEMRLVKKRQECFE